MVFGYRHRCHLGPTHLVSSLVLFTLIGFIRARTRTPKWTVGAELIVFSFMPETLRSLVGDGSIPPPPLNMSPPMFWRYRKAKKHGEEVEKVDRPPRKPVSP